LNDLVNISVPTSSPIAINPHPKNIILYTFGFGFISSFCDAIKCINFCTLVALPLPA
jgi:hypothetical protein